MRSIFKNKWFWGALIIIALLNIGFFTGRKIGKLIANLREKREYALKQKTLIAEIAGFQITKLEFQSALNRELLKSYYLLGIIRAADKGDMKISTFRQLVDDKILEVLGKEHKIKVSEKEIDEEITRVKKQLCRNDIKCLEDEEYYKSMIRLMGFREESELRKDIRYQLIEHKLAKKIFPDVKVTDEDIESNIPNLELQQIFLQYNNQTKAIVYEEAKKIHQLILNGKSFDELAKKHSNEVYAARGGKIGWIRRSMVTPAYWSVVSQLKEGEITDVFDANSGGYHIVKCLKKRNPGDKEYEAHKNLLKRVVEIQKRKNQFLFYFIKEKAELGEQEKIKTYAPYFLANEYVFKGNYGEAIKYLNESIKVDGEDPYIYLEIADLYFKQKKFKEAEKEHENAIKLAPEDPFLYLRLGEAYLKQGNVSKALIQFQRASSLSKYDHELHAHLEKVYKQLGLLKEAEKEHERFLSAIEAKKLPERQVYEPPKGTIKKEQPQFEMRELK